ncbi:MAG: 4,5-DOPA dioxygenase extradiol [Bacteroidota bacterium]|nr:4,5-DOPA dioxygenase extradiol [Bacteroidota bacterium]MDP4233270.1 4,5-DOPA dioxygenase extradiol [Bacteroidota bacterium]MDP4242110.1 4,5-DOPA dioxygenase extradiol [Bacteroidota bacterium]MDP4288611.1 4,5-DOPA dioxygenase extradiol [Bacteroidota bacterium]
MIDCIQNSSSDRMPLMFVGHGNPMNAIVDNTFSRTWREIGKTLPNPRAILSISAHWITPETTMVTAMTRPKTIHDFGGFPNELYQVEYPSPGAPEAAQATQDAVTRVPIALDQDWGLDHGTWSVLLPMFPAADIPVYQLSIDYGQPAEFHYEIGQQLRALREQGVLIMGSGNLVHNLRRVRFDGGPPYDWAIEFDAIMAKAIQDGDHRTAIEFQKLGALAQMAHPTYDHFLPLLYVLGATDPNEQPEFFNSDFDFGSASMRSMIYR